MDFYAYYPFVFPLTDYTYPLDVTVQSSQEAVDFMYAGKVEGCTKDNPKVGFNFVHKLSKLVLEISPGDGLNTADLRNLGVTVGNQPIKATFNLSNGTLMCGADKSDITLFTTESGTLSEAILLPNSVKSRVLTFDLNNGNDEPFTWTMDKALDAGSKYTYEVRLHRTKVEITSASITGWTPENGGAVDAAIFAGCDNGEMDNVANDGQVAIEVLAGIEGAKTRMVDTKWETRDKMGIFGKSGKLEYSNRCYNWISGNTFEASSNIIYYGAEIGSFTAYYPYAENKGVIFK